MFFRLLLLFTVVPLVELALLVWIGRQTSVLFTVALVLVTGVVGAALAKFQGWQTWWRIKLQLASGKVPGSALLDGLMILIAGVLLITPGILTDLVGFALLTPPVRAILRVRLAAWLTRRVSMQFQSFHVKRSSGAEAKPDDTIIDAEFTTRPVEPPDEKPDDRRTQHD